MPKVPTRLVIAASVALLTVAMLGGTAAARQERSQSGQTANDACLQYWGTSVASYRVDWTAYFDGVNWWFGYVESPSNTGSATLEGVDVFATAADLASGGSSDPDQPEATVSVDDYTGVVVGVIGFYGRSNVTTTADLYSLDTFTNRALGSYTVCFSSTSDPA